MTTHIDLRTKIKLCWMVGVIFIFASANPVYAYGPYVHYHAMKKAHDLLVSEYPEVPIL